MEKVIDLLRIGYLNGAEKDTIIPLHTRFSKIFYLDADKLTFTYEIKDSINTKDEQPICTKSYRYCQVHEQDVKLPKTIILATHH